MNAHYPRIRIDAGLGRPMVREGLSFNFFLRSTHTEAADAVLRSLDSYVNTVGPAALGWYADENGDLQKLDDSGWALMRHKLREERWPIVRLYETFEVGGAYRFEYYGKDRDSHPLRDTRNATCALSFCLPTEFLESQGPAHVRELGLKLASPLPFCSGYGGLSFNGELDVVGVAEELTPCCLRYPGIDVLDLERLGWSLGTRFRNPAWLTFLGQPVLGELGGAANLRSRLHAPGTTLQELDGDRALITLGEWPEAGDTTLGNNLPAYRELARVLEPFTFLEPNALVAGLPHEDALRWLRRFLG